MMFGTAAGVGTAAAETAPSEVSLQAAMATAKTWKDSAGAEQTVRALSADEVRALGLDKKIDMSKYHVVAPKVELDAKAVTPVERTTPASDSAASSCWKHSYRSGADPLFGQTDVAWCGDGEWVRDMANSNCWGSSSWPTYHYMGCNRNTNGGINWNLYEVKTVWDLCPAWIPIWGSCALHDYPVQTWQYFGNGNANRIE